MKRSFLEELKSRLNSFQPDNLDLSLTEQDLYQDIARHGTNDKLLGRFTAEEVRNALTQYGVWDSLRNKGYDQARIVIRGIDPFRQMIRIIATPAAQETEENILCELRVFDAHLNGNCPLTGKRFEVDALIIDWLTFQNPRASFTADKPPLPGQKYPGLGIMKTSMRAIIDLAKQIEKEAVINIPEYYHNAVLYQPAFKFFSAFVEGRFQALQKTLAHLSLADASHAVANGKVWNDAKDEMFVWKPHEQILGLVPRIVDYFEAELYKQKAIEAEVQSRFRLRQE